MSIKKGRKGRRLEISTETRKPNVITMLGHKYDRATLKMDQCSGLKENILIDLNFLKPIEIEAMLR